MRSIVLVGGGSVGHLAPCVAVREELLKQNPTIHTVFICSDRHEDSAYLALAGIAPTCIPMPRRSLNLPWQFLRGFMQARRILRKAHPDAVFSKGGAVSVPVCLAARAQGIPVILHESDVRPGYANRFLARIADAVCVGFAEARQSIRSKHIVTTGNPVRSGMTKGSRAEGLRLLGFDGRKPVLLILGGSQGALAVNRIIERILPELLQIFDVSHITGKGKAGIAERPGYVHREFAHAELPHFYAAASVAVSRAGAGAIAELAANGIPVVLVPLRGVAQDHQQANAEVAAKRGGCTVLAQEELSDRLRAELENILPHHERLSSVVRALANPKATQEIVDRISTEILRRRNGEKDPGTVERKVRL